MSAPGTTTSVHALVGRSSRRVAERIAEAKAFTEREVLACGERLYTLVDTVRDLTEESDRNAVASAARTREITTRFVDGMQDDMQAQQAAVRDVLTIADSIQTATASIERLTQMSHILALNMRIEAARAGTHGRGFAVIATQMREMAGTIRSAADEVNAAVSGVRSGLPTIMARATSMQERTQRFIAEMAERDRQEREEGAGRTQHERLDSVMSLSNAALSHLQFHDPLVKQLDAVVREVEDCERRLRDAGDAATLLETEGWSAEHPSAKPAAESIGSTPVPGGMVLF